MRGQVACPIADDSTIGASRRHAAQLADEAGLPETARGRLGIVVMDYPTDAPEGLGDVNIRAIIQSNSPAR